MTLIKTPVYFELAGSLRRTSSLKVLTRGAHAAHAVRGFGMSFAVVNMLAGSHCLSLGEGSRWSIRH